MAVKWRRAKWPALHSDDGEQTSSEHTEGSFTHKAHLHWEKKFLCFAMFKTVEWRTPFSEVAQGYLPERTPFPVLQDSMTESLEHRLQIQVVLGLNPSLASTRQCVLCDSGEVT